MQCCILGDRILFCLDLPFLGRVFFFNENQLIMKNIFTKEDIISLDGHLIGVSKEGIIKENEPYLAPESQPEGKWKIRRINTQLHAYYGRYKIIWSTNPELKGVPLLELPDEVVKCPKYINPSGKSISGDEALAHYIGFSQGYKAASKNKYSEEDMHKAYAAGWKDSEKPKPGNYNITKYLQSLKPIPTYIELETELSMGLRMIPSVRILKEQDGKVIVKEVKWI
jgi:hypothetical protein